MTMRVGVIGGGQLARMMIAPAVELGVDLRVLAEEAGMAAAPATTMVGDYRDAAVVLAFADTVDVVTFDHEHVPQPVLRELVARGVAVRPGPDAIQYAQDKLRMRARLAELGVPQPAWGAVATPEELTAFLADHGGRAVVKTPRGGYDGKGVRVVSAATEAEDWFAALAEDAGGGALLAEEFVPFVREVAQQVARRPSGEVAAYDTVATVQRDGVCVEATAPAPGADGGVGDEAVRVATAIAEGLGVTGMLAVEMFETDRGRVLVNELAMRPHNSGHWSQDGAVTSQFEQHLRAVLDLPLGSTARTQEWAVMANILGGPAAGGALEDALPGAMGRHPRARIHLYGKEPRPGRKVGHVTVTGPDLDAATRAARHAASLFTSRE